MQIRRAHLKDIDEILFLLNLFKDQDLLLPRNRDEMASRIRDFWVAEIENKVAGCVALHNYTEQMGEIRSLAVVPEFQKKGIAQKLVQTCVDEGKRMNLQQVFVLTYLEKWFQELGFKTVPKETLPEKIWIDCQFCPKQENCREIALTYKLS